MKQVNPVITGMLVWLMSAAVYAGGPVFTGEDGDVAVGGYDVVAYFTVGEPREGLAEFATQWRGAEWRFANEEHLKLFRQNPTRYAPAYGGYCAYGMAKGKALASAPEYWTIHDGRLYLNLNPEVHGNWNEDREGNIKAAEAHWPQAAK